MPAESELHACKIWPVYEDLLENNGKGKQRPRLSLIFMWMGRQQWCSLRTSLLMGPFACMQNLTVDEDLLEDDGEGGQRARPKESFFMWFDQVGPQGEVLSVDEISEIIHDQMWPNPLALYYGEAVCTYCLCFCVRVC
jgi:hypothetical protein